MDGWKDLPSRLINKIAEYVPPSRLIYIGLTCKPWYHALLGQIYRTIHPSAWHQSNFRLFIEKYYRYFREFDYCPYTEDNPFDLLKPVNWCQNIELIELSHSLLSFFHDRHLVDIFPNLKTVSIQEPLYDYKFDSQFKNLKTMDFFSVDLTEISQIIHPSLFNQLQQLRISQVEYDFEDLQFLISNIPNITHFDLHLEDRIIPHHEISLLFNLIAGWKNLLYLNMTFYLKLSREDPNFNSINSYPFQFPKNFSINQLKTFSIDAWVESDSSNNENSSENGLDSPQSTPTFSTDCHIHPNLFLPLFSSPSPHLNKLNLTMMDSNLLERISHSCPNLTQLTMDSPLPIPTSKTLPFLQLRKLGAFGFYPEALDHRQQYFNIFPKATVFLLDDGRFANWKYAVSLYHFIWKCFPNVTSVYIIVEDENEKLDHVTFWSQPIPPECQWSRMVIPCNMVGKAIAWIEKNASLLQPGFTLMINQYLPSRTPIKNQFRSIKNQYPEIDIFLCQHFNKFELCEIEII